MMNAIDVCVQPWIADLEYMKEYVREPWDQRLSIKAKIQDPVSGTFMPTLPWYHAFWNEDAPDYDGGESYSGSEQYTDPEKVANHLSEHDTGAAIITSHQMRHLPAIPDTEYAADLASAFNAVVNDRWVTFDRIKGSILVEPREPDAAVEEIKKYADDSEMVSVLLYGGADRLLGDDSFHGVYEAAADAGLPVTILPSGNVQHRQFATGMPEQYVTYDTNLVQNHMTNLASLIAEGVFDKYPDLKVVWGGQGVSWILLPLWKENRYFQNQQEYGPELEKEPKEYLDSNMYVTTYPLGHLPDEKLNELFQIVGYDNILYASGYPYWNQDTLDNLPSISDKERRQIIQENAKEVYDI